MRESRRILRIGRVQELTGLGRSTIYKWIKDGRFPAQSQIADNVSGWDSDRVYDWIDGKLEEGLPTNRRTNYA